MAGLVFLQTVRQQGEAATPPAALHRRVARRVFPRNRSNAFHRRSTPSLGAELHAPQEVRRGQQHDDGLYPNGDQAALPLPIGHPAPRSCRGNDACATGPPLQTPGLLQVLVCQTISRNQCGHLHLAGNLVAMSATHSTNQVIAGCWLGTSPLRLRSTSVLRACPWVISPQISSEPLFSESWGQIQLGWRQPRAPHYFLLECQDGWIVICFDNDTPTVSEAAASLHGSLNDISGIEI